MADFGGNAAAARRGEAHQTHQTHENLGATTTLFYNDAGQLTGEAYSGGARSNYSVTNRYDALLRRNYVGIRVSAGWYSSGATYPYDNASRLSTVDGAGTTTYGYLANSPLVGNVTVRSQGVTRLTVSKSYDYLNRLMSVTSKPGASEPLS